MIALKQVLVATDFSEPSEAAFVYGRALARQFGATLHVVHVVDQLAARVMGLHDAVTQLGHLQMEAEAAARTRLDLLLSEEDRTQLGATATVLTSTSASDSILGYARDSGVDLIVVGTHGRGGVARLVMGSVAERVVRSAPCPVLTVRHPEHEFVLPDALQAVSHA
jgi:nucleotide-binding universal stress UspA family protein